MRIQPTKLKKSFNNVDNFNPSIGDLVWVPQNTEVQKSYVWMDGFAYYPGDNTDHPLHAIVIDKFSGPTDTKYVGLAVVWKEKHIICKLEDVFPIAEVK